MNINDIIIYSLYFFGFILSLPLIIYFLPRRYKENGFIFSRYPLTSTDWGSFVNPEKISSGYQWTNVFDLKKTFKKSDKKRVFIDFFRFDDDYVRKSGIRNFFRKKAENTPIYFNPIDMRESLLFVGKMGSGKTQILKSFLNQKFYNRVIIHQVKVNDFEENYYRPKIDIVVNPYSSRAHLWDVMSEDVGIIAIFFKNLMNGVMGDKKDFFSAAANRRYNEIMNQVNNMYEDLPSQKRWLVFIDELKQMFHESQKEDQNSTKDVVSTMEQVLEMLEILAYQAQDPKIKKFTISDFFKRKNQCKLILDNNPAYKEQLTPYFSAFLASISQKMMSRPDTTKDFTLFAIDEYISLAGTLDESSKSTLHTLIRSKGGILMSFVQYIPSDNKKLEQLLTSSAFAWCYFSVIDQLSIEKLKKSVGETSYHYEERSDSHSEGKSTHSYSIKKDKINLISSDKINNLADRYEHIVYLPNKKMLYKGYTPSPELRKRAREAKPFDLTEFYKIKYGNKTSKTKEEVENMNFKTLFQPRQTLSKVERWKLANGYIKAKEENKLTEFAKKEQLIDVDLDLMFQDIIPNEKILDSKMKILSLNDRMNLSFEWQKIDSEDFSKQVEFITKHELWGAAPDIFNFDNQSLEDLELNINL